MKKMTKGAIVTGLGVALLLGGGGTLATWNAEQSVGAGKIMSGNLSLTVLHKDPWTSNITGSTVLMSADDDTLIHKIVPGEELTYEQQIVVGMEGEGMEALVKITGLNGITNGSNTQGVDDRFDNTLHPSSITVKGPDGSPLTGTYKDGAYTLAGNAKRGTYTINATVAFDAEYQQDMNSTVNLESINFRLEQLKPQAG